MNNSAPEWMSRAAALSATALALLLFAGCEPKPAAQASAPPPPEVEVVTLQPEEVPTTQEWIGTLDGLVHAHVHPQVTGYLMAQRYKEGTFVRKGELLYEIDPRPFQALLDQAQARLGKDELDVNRLKPLAREKAVSQQELDDAQQSLLADRAAVDQATVNLGFTKITAPIDGLAGLSRAQIGDLVGPGTDELTTVSTVDPIKVYFTVGEQEYLRNVSGFVLRAADAAATNAPLELLLADGSVHPHRGAFFATDNQLDARTGALRIAALFPNPDNRLLPGQYGRVRLTTRRAGVLLVPQRAVMELQDLHQVAVVDDQQVIHIRTVQMGGRVGPRWIVEQGLRPGERVVVEGVQKVRDGSRVQPRPFTGNGAAAAR